jgi:hypothetical protein
MRSYEAHAAACYPFCRFEFSGYPAYLRPIVQPGLRFARPSNFATGKLFLVRSDSSIRATLVLPAKPK